MKKIIFSLFALILLNACSTKVVEYPAETKTPSAPSLSKEEIMKVMKEAATPSDEHKNLAPLVGEWKTVSKFWESKDSKPQISKGHASHKWILGKRYIEEKFSGKWMDQPYTGIGILGYDKVKKTYFSTWIDNMGTGLMTSEGKYCPKKSTLCMTNEFTCPVSGATTKGRSVMKVVNKNKLLFEMFGPGQDGAEMKMMEIVYKRK